MLIQAGQSAYMVQTIQVARVGSTIVVIRQNGWDSNVGARNGVWTAGFSSWIHFILFTVSAGEEVVSCHY